MRRAVLMRLGVAWLAVAGLGCFSPSEPRVGGESHWLVECSHDTQCGDGLSCVCGTCTHACSKDEACAGSIDAACYDPSSPLLLKRCEDRSNAESHGVCLPHCLQAQDCGETRTCMRGACVPRTKADVPGATDGTDAQTPIEVGTSTGAVPWSEPVQVPVPHASIAAGDDSLVGVWHQTNCGDTNVPGMFECILRLEIERDAEGAVTGHVFYESADTNPSAPFAPASDPDVGYPTERDVSEYDQLYSGPLKGNPYRMLDGHLASGRFTFSWSAFDPWHDWCGLQTPYPWQVGDRRFYFCVPQDENARAAYDPGKVALCTSADFLKLCRNGHGDTLPCVCGGTPPMDAAYPDERENPALCTPAYCHCDEHSCDMNNAFSVSEDLAVTGDQMMGTWNDNFGNGPRSVTFERSQP